MSAVAYYAGSVKRQWRKIGSYLRRDFNTSKCKTWARMTTARIKLLRNKREALVRQMRRDVACLLQSHQDQTARIRVEHVIREQNMLAANEIIELFCERIVTRLSIISKQRDCPADLKEPISSLIFAAPRCSDIPELLAIRGIFQIKYGKDFVSAATDLRPHSGVNRLLIEKLSALNPPGELKLKVMKEIAKEYQVAWDTAETEADLLKPPDERIEGPRTFVSASSLPLDAGAVPPNAEAKIQSRSSGDMNYQDVASAARAAADCAKNAVAAAQAAAELAQTGSYGLKQNNSSTLNLDYHARSSMSPYSQNHDNNEGRNYRSQSLGVAYNGSDNVSSVDMENMDLNERRHSYNVRRVYTDMKFDDLDCDGEESPLTSSKAKTSGSPSVHPKLPDYDAIAARFEELKYRKT